jgi:CHASE3 domain sensor protein
MNIRDTIQKEVAELKTFRDELKVQAHLGAAEAKNTWLKLEAKWPELERRMQLLEDESSDAVQRMADATKDLMSEIRSGYNKLKKEVKRNAN